MKHTLTLLTALLLAPLAALHAAEPPAKPAQSAFADYPATMSELAAARETQSRFAESMMTSVFRRAWTSTPNLVEAAKAFHATRAEWVIRG